MTPCSRRWPRSACTRLAMLTVAGVLAVVVYQKVGVEVLRRAWINLDFIWAGALVVVGGLALGLGLWPVLVG